MLRQFAEVAAQVPAAEAWSGSIGQVREEFVRAQIRTSHASARQSRTTPKHCASLRTERMVSEVPADLKGQAPVLAHLHHCSDQRVVVWLEALLLTAARQNSEQRPYHRFRTHAGLRRIPRERNSSFPPLMNVDTPGADRIGCHR
jgi:hypothetical protein